MGTENRISAGFVFYESGFLQLDRCRGPNLYSVKPAFIKKNRTSLVDPIFLKWSQK
jgi:hypothetical protein